MKAPPEMFTGDAWFDVIAAGQEPSRIRVNVVRFAPGHFMTRLAMWESPGESQLPETQWGDLVTSQEYNARPDNTPPAR